MRNFLRIQVQIFCCYLGGMAGAGLSVATFGRWALERYQAEHPGEYVCGMFPLPYILFGFVAGAVAGWLLYRWGQPGLISLRTLRRDLEEAAEERDAPGG